MVRLGTLLSAQDWNNKSCPGWLQTYVACYFVQQISRFSVSDFLTTWSWTNNSFSFLLTTARTLVSFECTQNCLDLTVFLRLGAIWCHQKGKWVGPRNSKIIQNPSFLQNLSDLGLNPHHLSPACVCVQRTAISKRPCLQLHVHCTCRQCVRGFVLSVRCNTFSAKSLAWGGEDLDNSARLITLSNKSILQWLTTWDKWCCLFHQEAVTTQNVYDLWVENCSREVKTELQNNEFCWAVRK